MSDLGVPKQSGGNRSALSREVVVAGVGVDQRELVESEVLQLRGRLDAAQRVAAADALAASPASRTGGRSGSRSPRGLQPLKHGYAQLMCSK